MSDNEIFEMDNDSVVFIPKTKNKSNQNKKKASMSPERREKLLAQLARGRATSALNRGKKAKANKIKKQDEITERDELIYKDIEKKKNKVAVVSAREKELEEKLELATKALAAAAASPPHSCSPYEEEEDVLVAEPVAEPAALPEPASAAIPIPARKPKPWEIRHLW